MFTKAFLEQSGNGRLPYEESLLRLELERRGIPVTLYTSKKIQRRQLPLSKETFIAGDMVAMHGAMNQLNVEIPAPNDYPQSLLPFMHRKVWTTTLGGLERAIAGDEGRLVFAKPAERRKCFTGRVFATQDDFRLIGDVSRRQEVLCSEVVNWASEFRVYVIGTGIVSIDRYAGDPEVRPDRGTIDAALKAFRDSGEAPSAYGIDFGVLSTGQTALVEANDGYALGAYQIPAALYTDLLLTRWSELVSSIPL